MTKADLAEYLVNLHILMEAQQATGGNLPSTFLADEYNKHWGLLKATITKENEHEARHSDIDRRLPKIRTDSSPDQSSRGERDREHGRE